MVAFDYVDKNESAIKALKDYDRMKDWYDTTLEEIKELSEDLYSPRTTNFSGIPGSGNPAVAENWLDSRIDMLDVLRDRYRKAREYMLWFGQAWQNLTAQDREILREFYTNESQRSGATSRLVCDLHYSERQIERLRSKALSRLAQMLY